MKTNEKKKIEKKNIPGSDQLAKSGEKRKEVEVWCIWKRVSLTRI